MKNDCVFCREIKGNRNTNFAMRYPEIRSRVLSETNSLIAFPCIGQLTSGHFLIVTKAHFPTFSKVNSNNAKLTEELDSIIRTMHIKLGFDVNDSLFFEHGALNSSDGGCGIYHAHIHVVPNAKSIKPKEIFDFDNNDSNPTIQTALSSIISDQSYVLVGNYRTGFYSCPIKNPLPSQTLRKTVASALDLEKWDWRKTQRENSMIALLKEAS